MNQKTLFLALCLISGSIILSAQSDRVRNKTVRGSITDQHEQPIEGVQIYVDMLRTSAETNDSGNYKLKTTTAAKLITAWHPDYGIINWKYNGEKKISFVFPENSPPMSKKELEEIGYTTELFQKEVRNWYGDYNNIMEILDNKFNQVRVTNGQIIVGRGGPHVFNADQKPLILVNKIPTSIEAMNSIPTTEVESINIVHKGSELAQYGFRGVNGVILIELKDGNSKG